MKYYIYNSQTNTVTSCDSKEQLIAWFAARNSKCWFEKKVSNRALDDIAMNKNDMRSPRIYLNGPQIVRVSEGKRSIMVIDEYDRIIDPREFKDEILRYKFKYNPNKKILHHKPWEQYIFRGSPVPHIHKRVGSYGQYFKHPQTTQEKRKVADPELKEFVRPSRNFRNLPNTYDDKPSFRYGSSWKMHKLRRQWMKHCNKHIDYIHREKEYYEDEDIVA